MNKNFKICCEVCGDRAIGRNFARISCEPCKAFFRRNAFKYQTLKCFYDRKCIINPKTRKFCTKCRLKKCFAIGMKKELIMCEEKREYRRHVIERNRLKKTKGSDECVGAIDSSKHLTSVDINSSNDTIYSQTSDSEDFLTEILKDNTISDEEINKEIIEIENYLTNDGKHKTSDQSLVPIFRHIPRNKGFTDLEIHRLSELSMATKIFKYPSSKNTIVMSNMDRIVYKMIYSVKDREITDFVKLCKSLSAFISLCENDQIALSKYGFYDCIGLQYFYGYNFESKCWTYYLNNENSFVIGFDVLKIEYEDIYQLNVECLPFIQELKNDFIALNLLTAIVLFNPNRQNLIHYRVVKLQQQMYIYLLQRYLQSKYGSEYDSKLCKFMTILPKLQQITQLQKKDNEEKYREYMGPLHKEILDLC